MRYWGHVRKTKAGGYYIQVPAQVARILMRDWGLSELKGVEVRVEVVL